MKKKEADVYSFVIIPYRRRRNILDWTVEHVRPNFGWNINKDEEENVDLFNTSIDDLVDHVSEHLMTGISFKWKIWSLLFV